MKFVKLADGRAVLNVEHVVLIRRAEGGARGAWIAELSNGTLVYVTAQDVVGLSNIRNLPEEPHPETPYAPGSSPGELAATAKAHVTSPAGDATVVGVGAQPRVFTSDKIPGSKV